MTQYFISRVFEEHASVRPLSSRGDPEGTSGTNLSPPEMSLEDFCDFVLAWEHRASAVGVKYFMPVLDTRHKGYITQVGSQPFLVLACR